MPALAIDHLVYVTANVDETSAELEQLLGLRPAGGGSHVGRGTRNTLLALGPDVYLEVLGPDPEQERQPPRSQFGTRPLLRTWAARAPEIEESCARALAQGVDLGQVRPMSRRRPDGVLLNWLLTAGGGGGLGRDGSVSTVPFLIDWGESEHPALSAPSGCTLLELRAEDPDPTALGTRLRAVGVELSVSVGLEPALIALISSPNGRIELR